MARHRSNHPGSKSGGFADWLGAALHCVVSSNPPTWSSQLHRTEYAHNLLISTANGLSPFEVSLGYQPPLFLAPGGDLAVSSIQHHLRCCHHVWKQNKATLLRTADQNRHLADTWRTPEPQCIPGQNVRLSSKVLNQTISRSSQFACFYENLSHFLHFSNHTSHFCFGSPLFGKSLRTCGEAFIILRKYFLLTFITSFKKLFFSLQTKNYNRRQG